MLREEGVSFRRVKTWKASKDPDYAAQKARVEHLYAIADREVVPEPGEPEVLFCVDEFGPLNLAATAGPALGCGQREGLKSRAGRRCRGCAPLIPARQASGTCSRPMGWAKTICSGTSSRARPGPGSWNSAATCAPVSRVGPDRDHLRQLQPAPDHQTGRPGRGLGGREQRRDRLHADELVLVKPRRGTVHRAAVLAGRHRPRQPQRAGQHDPPVHHLAEQERVRRTAPPHRRPGKRSLMRHSVAAR